MIWKNTNDINTRFHKTVRRFALGTEQFIAYN